MVEEQAKKAVSMKHSFLIGLFFYPEDKSNMFLRNIALISTDSTALYPRR
jgi:hypothetical protein